MPPFFSNKKLIILLTSLIVLVALIGFSMKERARLTWPEQFIHDTVGGAEFIFNRPAQYVAGLFENISEIKSVYKENKKLKAQLKDYAALQAKYQVLNQEFQSLEKQLKIGSLLDYKARPALVIGRSFDEWNKMITVDKGAQQGIQKGMAVVTPEGYFIGKVTAVSQLTSVVTLITDPSESNQISAAVVNKNERAYGMIEGYNADKNVLMFEKIPIDKKVKKGDKVTTSGLGGVYPEGLLIGEVVSVKPDEYGLTKIAEVKPSADFNAIDYVDIIERTAVSSSGSGDAAK
ncbi:rod shape-determining protein MreC [Caenibacillus caldisaponilyticus]|jgi:rod shape-determining protein MreC|uniref:rod shape-determining protein MreC n=1 Tax=Caenibacillus caldisaponilyticus TaxID=1674942 RepID=UPI0009887C67|nr:rod shape-determining protein MreC [Caenibacillus caldisaponilyticus]